MIRFVSLLLLALVSSWKAVAWIHPSTQATAWIPSHPHHPKLDTKNLGSNRLGGVAVHPRTCGVGLRGSSTDQSSDTSSSSSHHYEDDIARLQHDFKYLQEQLLQQLVLHHDTVAAEDVAEQMLDMAADAVALQRYQQMNTINRLQHEMDRARDDRTKASSLRQQAHEVAMSAEQEAKLLESLDANYEDLERIRELSKAHAAHRVEDDARELEIESTFQELEAEFEQEAAEQAIAELRDYERRLRESVQQIRQLKSEAAVKEWKEQELHKYDSFLDQVKDKFNL